MTQQEWKWLKKSLVLDLGWGGSTERILEHIIAAYPSSPQGLAAKALVEALEQLALEWEAKCPEKHLYYLEGFRHASKVGRETLEVARKAGLTP